MPSHGRRGPWLQRQAAASSASHPAPRTARMSTTAAADATVGVVIVDHGSRRKASNEMLEEFGKLYQQTTQRSVVEIAHMEIAEPTIEQAIGGHPACCLQLCFAVCPMLVYPLNGMHYRTYASWQCCKLLLTTSGARAGKCISRGAKHVVIAPYFLSKGRHIQDDIPALVKEASEKYPTVPLVIADPIGEWLVCCTAHAGAAGPCMAGAAWWLEPHGAPSPSAMHAAGAAGMLSPTALTRCILRATQQPAQPMPVWCHHQLSQTHCCDQTEP